MTNMANQNERDMHIISADDLRAFVVRIFVGAGVTPEIAERTAIHLVDSNLAGVDSHGVMRIPDYIGFVFDGRMARDNQIEVIREKGAMILLDAHFTFGQFAAWHGAGLAIEKARQSGIGIVSARNSAHIGRLGEYVERIARAGMIGFMCCNLQGSGQRVAPFGGAEGRLGTNPVAWGIPSSDQPMIMDMSTSVSAEGKIRVKMRRGEELPPGWLLDSSGRPTTNPADLYGPPFGAILTTGGHKGYGLSLMVESLAGALSKGGVAHDSSDIDSVENAFTIIAIDIAWFQPLEAFTDDTDKLFAHMRATRPVQPGGEVLIPGEPEQRMRVHRLAHGIGIEMETWERLLETAERFKIHL